MATEKQLNFVRTRATGLSLDRINQIIDDVSTNRDWDELDNKDVDEILKRIGNEPECKAKQEKVIDHILLNLRGVLWESDGKWAIYKSKDQKYIVRLEIGNNLLTGQIPEEAKLEVVRSE